MSDRMPGQRFRSQSNSPVPEPDAEERRIDSGPAAPVTPQRYRANAPLIGVIASLAGLALLVTIVTVGNRWPGTTSTSTPTQSDTQSSMPGFTPSPDWQGIEFTSSVSGASGYWQISPPTWVGNTVTVTTTLTVVNSSMRFSFFALDNKDTNYYEPTGGTMTTGTVQAGESETGTIVLEVPRGDFTLYLATASGRQVTALIVSG